MKAERGLDRPDFGRTRGNDIIADERQFDAASQADAVHAGDQGDRQELSFLQELYSRPATVSGTTSTLQTRAKHREVSPGREVTQAAAYHDRSTTSLISAPQLVQER